MVKENQITVVCFANYCRSPCAEFLLREKFKNRFNVTSAGIEPIIKTGMDYRTQDFLDSEGIKVGVHNPKKINQKLVKESKYIFSLDYEILGYLNRLFPNSGQKIKLLSFQQPKIKLPDPYQMNSDDYVEIMKLIKEVCDNLRL